MTSITPGKKLNPRRVSLRQLERMNFFTREGAPATLYQIIVRPFFPRSRAALEAAAAGDFTQLETLEDEIDTLISQFVKHMLYLQEEGEVLKNPAGPVAIGRAALIALARKREDEAGL